jgi:CRISPR-associated protein Cmr6
MSSKSDPTYRNSLSNIYKHLTGETHNKPAGAKLLDDGKGIHAGLWLDKYIGRQTKDDTTSRRTLVEQVAHIPISETYRQFYERWTQLLDTEYKAQIRYGEVKGRMVVGLGDESVLETSVALHRTYGVPYIPGSALKGLAAHYANLRAPQGSGWKKGEAQYNVVFGNTEEEGNVIFFDALYIPEEDANKRPLHPDVITVHHREYYQDQDQKKAPADWDSPTPIPFLSATGEYLIALAAPELPEADQWLNGVFSILELALEEMGIGAKTSSGYGRMVLYIDSEERALDPKVQECIQAIRNLPQEFANQKSYDYYKQWKEDFSAPEDRLIIARELIKRIRETGYEAVKSKKPWFQELVACVLAAEERE